MATKEETPKNPTTERVAAETPKAPVTTEVLAALLKDVDANQLQVLVSVLRTTKRPLSVAPTVTPRNFLQQFELYENGATIRLYTWVNGTWRYVALT